MKVTDPKDTYAELPVFSCEKDIYVEEHALGLHEMSLALQDIRRLVIHCARMNIITDEERNASLEQLYYIERAVFAPIETVRRDLHSQSN